jgi:hypothetical protein
MRSKVANAVVAMVAMVALCIACVAKGYVTMGNSNSSNSTKAITTSKGATQPATSSPAMLAPQQAVQQGSTLAVLAPSTQPASGPLYYVGTPSTAKTATNGIGPAPGAKTVGYAALQAIAAGNGAPVALTTVQAAITAVGCKGKHPVLPLLRWLANNRGYSFTITNGTHVVLGCPAGAANAK